MKRIICFTIFLLAFNSFVSLNAQWAITYGESADDEANCVQHTSDGGYIISGYTVSPGSVVSDIWILKLSLAGDIEWQRTYGGSANDVANSIQQTSDEGYVVAGYTDSFGSGRSDIWILKLSSSGDIEWQHTYGGSADDVANSIQQTSDGGYIVAGCTMSSGGGRSDIWILKLSSSGETEWQRTYGGNTDDVANSIQQTSDEGYIVAGYTYPFGTGETDFWVLKLYSNGDVDWEHTYRGNADDMAYSIQQTDDEGYIIAGYTDSFGAGESDIWVLKLYPSGRIDWERTYGGSADDVAYSVQQTDDEGYIIAGYTDSFGAGESGFWALKLYSNGDIDWERIYGGSADDVAYAIQQTDDEGYIIAGYTNSFGAGESDFLILKLSLNGDIDPLCELIGSSYAEVLITYSIYSYTNIIPQSTSFSPQYTYIFPQETSATENIICEALPSIYGYVKTEEGEGIDGVTIKFSDENEEEDITITDSEGYYIYTVSYGWSGTATPSKTGYAFSPPSRNYTYVTSNQMDQDYTAYPGWIISGHVKTEEDEGIEGVTITFSDEGGTVTTDSEGSYSHTVKEGWSGTATPSKTCYTFSPSNRNYTNVISDQTNQNYTGLKLTYKISGSVRVASSPDEPLSGVVMSGLPGNPTTNASGYYEATVDCGWSGTVTPTRERYVFSPINRTFRNVSSNQSSQNYTAYPGWIISGAVRTEEAEAMSGVPITFSNEGGATATNSEGNYSHTVIEGWTGTATPVKVGYTFTPSSRDYSNVTSDQTNQNYTGAPIPYTLTINADEGGTTQPSPGSYIYYYGTQVEITGIPDSGYEFSHWSEDVPLFHEKDNPLSITINSDRSINAIFKRARLCFIATATYGSSYHPYVKILRDFRDTYLMCSKLGRLLIRFYYKHSPFAAYLIARHKILRVGTRISLLPLVVFSYSMLHLGPAFTAVILFFIFLFPIFLIYLFQRRIKIYRGKKIGNIFREIFNRKEDTG